VTDPIDMSDKPRHTGWGSRTDAEGGTDLSPADLLRARRDADPIYSRYKSFFDTVEASGEPLERLFDGDASRDDLAVLAQSLISLYLQMSDVVDIAFANRAGPDPSYIAGELVSLGLDFVLALVQPLQDAVGMATGNPERIGVSAAMWSETASALDILSQRLSGAAAAALDVEWQGAARDAAIQRLAEFQEAVFTARIVATLLQELMERTAEFVQALQNRAKTMYAEAVGDVVGLVMTVLGNYAALVDVLWSARSKFTKAALDILNMVLQGYRIHKALSLLTDELAEEFEKTAALLDRLAACR